jgi:Ala-tRNA(Pro) deacylase
MPATEEDLFARLSELGIETETVRHPAVFTVEESKALRGDLPGGHTKNLFLKDKKGALWLVVALEDRAVDMKDLRRRIGSAQLSFGRPELLKEVLGIEPGSVTPFAVINDTEQRVNVVLDAEMMSFPVLNFHPLTNTATTSVTPEGLAAFIRSCGHEPAVVAL